MRGLPAGLSAMTNAGATPSNTVTRIFFKALLQPASAGAGLTPGAIRGVAARSASVRISQLYPTEATLRHPVPGGLLLPIRRFLAAGNFTQANHANLAAGPVSARPTVHEIAGLSKAQVIPSATSWDTRAAPASTGVR